MRYLVLLGLLALAFAVGCSTTEDEGGTGPATPEEQVAADSVAGAWFEALADSMGSAMGEDFDMDAIEDMDVDEVRTGLEEAVALDPDNGLAHLGLCLVHLIEINYNSDLWEMADSLESWFDQLDVDKGYTTGLSVNPLRNRLLGHQFRILAESPFYYTNIVKTVPPNLTVRNLQNIIQDSVIPQVNLAITEVELAEAAGVEFSFQSEGEVIEIDMGEVFFFDASLRALRAGLRIMTGYNVDIFGPDGTYDWIEDLLDLEDDYDTAEIIPGTAGGDTLVITRYNLAQIDSVLMEVVSYNVSTPSSAFLTLRTDPYSGRTALQNAGVDLGTMLARLEAALDFIRNENDPQDDDVIQLGFLTDVDSDIADCEDCPAFAEDWETIEDVIDWVQVVLAGPYTIDVEDGFGDPAELTVNLSVLLSAPVADWKTKLPYHQWAPADEWFRFDEPQIYEWDTSTSMPVCEDFNEDWTCWTNIDYEVMRYIDQDFDGAPVWFTDSQGTVLDEEEFPYFPDYTFGGLFPGMTRQEMMDLMGIETPGGK
ncbi:MAG: hypothetical protein ABIF77_08845 [bacterium]